MSTLHLKKPITVSPETVALAVEPARPVALPEGTIEVIVHTGGERHEMRFRARGLRGTISATKLTAAGIREYLLPSLSKALGRIE